MHELGICRIFTLKVFVGFLYFLSNVSILYFTHVQVNLWHIKISFKIPQVKIQFGFFYSKSTRGHTAFKIDTFLFFQYKPIMMSFFILKNIFLKLKSNNVFLQGLYLFRYE